MRLLPRSGLLAGSALLLGLPSLHAQDAAPRVNALEPGARALSFGRLGEGGGAFGFWRMRSATRSVGFFVGLDASRQVSSVDVGTQEDEAGATGVFLSVGPTVRRYLDTTGRVAPFVYSHLSLGYGYTRRTTERESPPTDHTGTSYSAGLSSALGVGAEWFPTANVSFAGQTGLRGSVDYSRTASDPAEQDTWTFGLRTFTAALSLNLYLPPRR